MEAAATENRKSPVAFCRISRVSATSTIVEQPRAVWAFWGAGG